MSKEKNGTPCGYIADGYTLTAYLAEVPRLYPALRFTYRAVLAQNRAVIFREMDKAAETDPRKAESISAAAMVAQLVSWDLVDQKGEAVPISASNILRLQPTLGVRLFRVLMGREAPDEDPAIEAVERNEQSSAQLAAALAGKAPEEADVKN